MDVEALISLLAGQAEDWIHAQRALHWPGGATIRADVAPALAAYFTPATLASARVAVVDALADPPFYAALRQQAPDLPLIEFAAMDGITFNDAIVVGHRGAVPNPVSLLFHELVHVVQYSQLGVRDFAHRYVRGWASAGMRYDAIPLEVDAYALQDRFDRGEPPFSAEEVVARQLAGRPAT